MPERIIKRIRRLGIKEEYPAGFGVDFDDLNTWQYYSLRDNELIRCKVLEILDEKGEVIKRIDKNFDLEIYYSDVYRQRCLYLPKELVLGYGVKQGMAIDLILIEVLRKSDQGDTTPIYPERLVEGPIDIKPKARVGTTIPTTVSGREDLLKRLTLNLRHFEVASDYFEEAKSCFRHGFMRAATIVAISALESSLKTDYLRIKHEEYDGKLSKLLNRYFSGDLKRLPKQYEDFTNTYIKIRNSLTHPEDFDYSEHIVFNVLSTVAELMKTIEKQY